MSHLVGFGREVLKPVLILNNGEGSERFVNFEFCKSWFMSIPERFQNVEAVSFYTICQNMSDACWAAAGNAKTGDFLP